MSEEKKLEYYGNIHVTHTFPLPIDASYKIWLRLAKAAKQIQRRIGLNIVVIYSYMYIDPGQGPMNIWCPFFLGIIDIQFSAHFLQIGQGHD